MTWYQYFLGWLITNLWLIVGLAIGVGALWIQGWLAGRKYYNRGRDDPWGKVGGRMILELVRAAKREDRGVLIHPETDWWQELPTGERITLRHGRYSDGQSIPPLARIAVGGPFDGRSREINIGSHDEECDRKQRDPVEVHGIGYCGMQARGMWFRGPIIHAVQLNWGARWPWPPV